MVIKHYKLNNKFNKKIVLLSDVHYYRKTMIPNLCKITYKIKEIKPDYICIVGDLVDNKNIEDKEQLINWIKDLSLITTVLISFGNHEYKYNHKLTKSHDNRLFNIMNKINNVYVLNNKNIFLDGINFIGINLPYNYYNNKEKASELVKFMNKKYSKLSKHYNILLCHSPYVIAREKILSKLKCKDDIDLILSGHMHAGLSFEWSKKILRGRGIITPQKKIFQKYCYGRYNYNKINIIISSGVTKLSRNHLFNALNFLYKSEIVVIEI